MKKTPLGPGTKPLKRLTPLKSNPTAEKREKTTSRTATGRYTGMGRARDLVYARSGGVCELQILGICLGRAANWHHRRDRSLGGLWLASNGIHSCGSGSMGCHGAVTNTNGHRAEYVAKGWIVESYDDPATVPVLLWPMGVVLLDDDGGWTQFHPDDLPILRTDSQQEGAA